MSDFREKMLIKNTGLYFIGNFASKILNVLLVPIYMIYLNAEDFGGIDLVLLLSSIVALLFTLDMTDAAYRFMIDADSDEKKYVVISNTFVTYVVGMMFLSCLFFPVYFLYHFEYGTLFILHVLIANFSQYLMQLCRGLKYNGHYAIAGSILTFIQAVSNIVLILFFNVGASSLLISQIIGSAIVIIFLSKVTRIYKYIKLNCINKLYILDMVKYSIPMFLQVLLLWVIQNSGTYFLRYYTQNNVASGVYAMANKIPTVINSLASIFLLAWQESAIVSKNDSDVKQYYRKIYSTYFYFMIAFTTMLLPVLRIYFASVGNDSYGDVWRYVPIFCFVSVINGLAMFVGTQFIAEKKTIKIVKTLILPVCLTLIINFFGIKYFGIYALGVAQIIGYFVMLMQRKHLTPKTYSVQINLKNIMILLCSVITVIVYYCCSSLSLQFCVNIVNLGLILWFSRNDLRRMCIMFLERKTK